MIKITACKWDVLLAPGGKMIEDPMKAKTPYIEKVGQIKGPAKFAVRRPGVCMTKGGDWEYEPLPSSRDDDFMERCRFNTLEEALETYKQSIWK